MMKKTTVQVITAKDICILNSFIMYQISDLHMKSVSVQYVSSPTKVIYTKMCKFSEKMHKTKLRLSYTQKTNRREEKWWNLQP